MAKKFRRFITFMLVAVMALSLCGISGLADNEEKETPPPQETNFPIGETLTVVKVSNHELNSDYYIDLSCVMPCVRCTDGGPWILNTDNDIDGSPSVVNGTYTYTWSVGDGEGEYRAMEYNYEIDGYSVSVEVIDGWENTSTDFNGRNPYGAGQVGQTITFKNTYTSTSETNDYTVQYYVSGIGDSGYTQIQATGTDPIIPEGVATGGTASVGSVVMLTGEDSINIPFYIAGEDAYYSICGIDICSTVETRGYTTTGIWDCDGDGTITGADLAERLGENNYLSVSENSENNIIRIYYSEETTSFAVVKEWSDSDTVNHSSTQVLVNVYKDEEMLYENVSLNENGWYAWFDLAKYNTAGEEIVYTVVEDSIPNYYASYDYAPENREEYEYDTENVCVITNTYQPPYYPPVVYTSYTLTVTWEDADGNLLGTETKTVTECLTYDANSVKSGADRVFEGYTYSGMADGSDPVTGTMNGNKNVTFVYTVNEEVPDETPDEPTVDIPDEDPPMDDSPKTGDESMVSLLWLAFFASFSGLVVLGLTGRKKREER